MKRVWELTEKDKEHGFIFSDWDGDCYTYTICDNEKEYEEEKARRESIENEYEKTKREFLKDLQMEQTEQM